MSINVPAIASADLKIMDLVARWPGSSQDQTIWNSSFRNAMFDRGHYGDAVLLAESGYMNKPYIMMPLDNPRTPDESLYTEAQIRSRNPVKSLFWVWKRRFSILSLGMQIELKNCLAVVATGVFHNILMKSGRQFINNYLKSLHQYNDLY